MPKSVLIIGAGPAGMIAAANLVNHGIDATIVEKGEFPRILVGESLLPLSMEHFEKVGILSDLEEQKYNIKIGARFVRGEEVCMFDFKEHYTEDSKTYTWQVPRADFDETIAKAVMKKGVKILFNTTLTSVSFEGQQVIANYVKGHQPLQQHFDFIIDASGFGNVLPRLLDKPVYRSENKNAAIFTHVKDDQKALSKLPHPERIAFDVIHKDLWLWVIPFADGTTSIGLTGHEKYFAPIVRGDMNRTEFLQHFFDQSFYFKDRFQKIEPLFEPQSHIGFSQYCKDYTGDQYVMIGNVFEFIDPVFSSGVALATASAMKATDTLIEAFQKNTTPDWKEYRQYIEKGANTFKAYVDAWYHGHLQDILFAHKQVPQFKEMICSVLAGYAWDDTNPFVTKPEKSINALAKVIQGRKKMKSEKKV